jgi:hypothetical protein
MQSYPFIHSDDPDCAVAADKLELVCAHDCPAQPLQWLWPEKIPLGKVTLLIGDPGTGKSLLATKRLDRQRGSDRRSEGNGRPPSTTGHPILDAILEQFRKPPPTTSPQHPSSTHSRLLHPEDEINRQERQFRQRITFTCFCLNLAFVAVQIVR